MCAGVRRALATADQLLEHFPKPVYALHELVHNNYIVGRLRTRGMVFVETLDEVPEGAVLLFSAHGVGAAVEQEAHRRKLRVVDATCPLVKRLQLAAARESSPGEVLILIGHRGHPEVEGVLGRADGRRVFVVGSAAEALQLPEFPGEVPVRLLAQTTLSSREVDEIAAAALSRCPQLEIGPGVCYATANRQAAVRLLAKRAPLVFVIGSPRSSNSNRLREIAAGAGARAFLIDGPDELPEPELREASVVGVTAGASAPGELVEATLKRLLDAGFGPVEPVISAEEEMTFRLSPLP